MKKVKVGNWVRFYRSGILVIGVVQYIHPPKLGFTFFRVDTDQGTIDSESILEIR
jgi:hypothetical protein